MNEKTQPVTANPADVVSVNAIIKALYESVSFPPGRQPDYTRLRTLFHLNGIVIPPRTDHSAEFAVTDVETFINRSRQYVITTGMERKGFHENEIARRTESFGSIVHVFSTYESRYQPGDPTPIQRGINSIQLGRDGKRWCVLSILWDVERPGNPIPKDYAP
ncbi:MAG: hypothetical protein HY033_01810 [Ignavibacteriae bacterium]|nr:hypothetical protein [Ignavibacteria bacterium]MBI3363623.1 hypothetical protein [Ignavibacteriota bacterium]